MLPRDAGFYVIDERVYVRGWHDEVAELLTSGQVDTLVIDEWEQPGLSALVPLKRSIRRLSIQDPQVTDLSAVSELTGLSDLYVGEGSWPADAFEAIDF